jgi:predicted nuclease of predicted toxin-antitoxin system
VRFLLDESADIRLKAHLSHAGHDVTSVVPDYGAGLPDPDVLAIAVRDQRVLITDDLDFGELIFRRRLKHSGVVLFRLGPTEPDTKIAALDRLLDEYGTDLHRFFVISRRGIRVRTQPLE